jgi:hypothetical protein
MSDTNVELPITLFNNQDGSITQRSERAVVLLSTEIVTKLSRNSEESQKILYTLLMLFKGLLEENCNPDIVDFAVDRACKLLQGIVEEKEARSICDDLIKAAARRPNCLDGLFT